MEDKQSQLVGTLVEDKQSQLVGSLVEDKQNRQAGSLEMEVDNHILVEGEDIQQWKDMADQFETSAELVALPLAEAQICHHACPFQSCVVSAYTRRQCSKPYQTGNSAIEMLLGFLDFPQSWLLWKICMQVGSGTT